MPSMASTGYVWPLIDDAFLDPINEAPNFGPPNMALQLDLPDWSRSNIGVDPCYNELAIMNEGTGMQDLANVNLFDVFPPTQPYIRKLGNSKPADFLAIRKTQGR